MKKTTLLVAAFAASLMAAKTSFAGPQLFITKDTYACIDGSDTTPALLSKLIDAHDTAGIAALCQQGKVVPVQKGWEVGGTEYELPDNPMETVNLWAELQLRLKRTMMTLRRDCLSTQKVAEDQFNPADLPRIPIHKGRSRPTRDEQTRLVMANADRDISIDVDQGTLVHGLTTRAIALMFHLEKEIVNGSETVANPYVTYGPIPDAHNATDASYMDHTWLVEVSFYIFNEPTKRWTAVLHVRTGQEPVSCELGADTPTLKDNEAQPEAAEAATPSSARAPAPAPAIRDSDGPSDTAPPSEPAPAASDSLILRLTSAIDAHDYATVLSFLHHGRTDYFGHRNASSAFIEKDMQTDARTYRWVKSIPDLSTFRTFTDTEGIVHESIQMETSAQENSGKRHHAFVQMDISYRNEVPPSILSMDLRVLKGRSRLTE
jgi:hypothetical protein